MTALRLCAKALVMTLLVSAPAAGQRGPSIFLELDPDVPGSATEERIQVFAVNWGIEVPMDSDTERASAETVVHPVVVTKMVDRATPRLFQAAARGERFNRATLRYWRTNPVDGRLEQYFTLDLVDVVIARMEHSGTGSEELGLMFRRIEVVWENPAVMGEYEVIRQ